ncbi:MAG: hypothetical protein HIU89_18235 [Proteobacteria bacterium]|nr:hypothetical protein [Pseudomonadota bacterium]
MTDWNKPDSNEALRHWRLIDPLTLFQAVMLIFARDPSHEMSGKPRGYVPIMAALKQAIERREVPALQTRNILDGGFFSLDHEDMAFVKQADIRQWLETINHSEAFFFLAEPDDWPQTTVTVPVVSDVDKPLEVRERSNLLRIIRALAVMAHLPDRGAALAVEKQMSELRFDSPKEATIRSVLKEARDLEQ